MSESSTAPIKRILRRPEVKRRTGLSNTTMHEMIARHEFPSQIALGARAVGWVESEISEWIEARIAASRAAA